MPLLRRISSKVKPATGFSSLLHLLYRIVLPIAVFVLVRLDIGLWLPILVIMLSKWRIFAVRPRFWPANLRANSIDIIVGISTVLFLSNTDSILFVSFQAAIGQLAGLMALFLVRSDRPLYELVFLTGFICYLAARHFFDSFNEPYAKMLAYLWGYFGSAIVWVLGHMLVVYPKPDGIITMPTLLISAIGYSVAAVYYLEHFDRLSVLIKRELLFLSASIVIILIVSLYFEGSHLIV
jgi:hypothetical protein